MAQVHDGQILILQNGVAFECFLTLLQGHNSYFRQLVIMWMLQNKNNVQGKTKDRIGVHNIYDDGFMVSSLITKCTGSL